MQVFAGCPRPVVATPSGMRLRREFGSRLRIQDVRKQILIRGDGSGTEAVRKARFNAFFLTKHFLYYHIPFEKTMCFGVYYKNGCKKNVAGERLA